MNCLFINIVACGFLGMYLIFLNSVFSNQQLPFTIIRTDRVSQTQLVNVLFYLQGVA